MPKPEFQSPADNRSISRNTVYGLTAIGRCSPSILHRRRAAMPGDAIIVTKGIGVGIYADAFRKDALPPGAYEEMLASTTLLNQIGSTLADEQGRSCHDQPGRCWPAGA